MEPATIDEVKEDVDEEQEEDLQEPPKYKVIFHNDDYTPMQFVIRVLEQIFHKSSSEAKRLTMKVHNEGQGVAGVYEKQIAETKKEETVQSARENGHPLQVTIEKDE